MGFQSSVIKVYDNTITATGNTNGASQNGSNLSHGFLYGVFGTVTGTTPTVLPFIQVSPDNGTTWIGAAGAAAAGLISSPLQGTGTAVTAITAATAGTFIIPINGSGGGNGFPGSLWRVVVTAGGTPTSVPLKIYADFQKWFADNS